MTTTDRPRSEGPGVQEYLDRDSRPVPDSLRYNRNDQFTLPDLIASGGAAVREVTPPKP